MFYLVYNVKWKLIWKLSFKHNKIFHMVGRSKELWQWIRFVYPVANNLIFDGFLNCHLYCKQEKIVTKRKKNSWWKRKITTLKNILKIYNLATLIVTKSSFVKQKAASVEHQVKDKLFNHCSMSLRKLIIA